MAFWIEHRSKYTTNDRTLRNHVITINQLETFTGINFFYNLRPDIQAEVESDVNLADWNL
jgi:endonuclease G